MYPDPRLIPIEKIAEENLAFTIGNDVLATAITPSMAPSLLKIMVATDALALFKANVTPSGGSERTIIFGSDANLTVNVVYVFNLLMLSGDSINFELDNNGNLVLFRAIEIPTGIGD